MTDAETSTPLLVDVDISSKPPEDTKPNNKRRRSSRTASADSKSKSPFSGVPYEPGVIAKGLTELYGTIGTFLSIADPVCGQAFIANAEQAANSLERLAKQNETARRVLMSIVKTSVVGEVVAAHAPMVMVIAMHHGPKKLQPSHNEEPQQNNGNGPTYAYSVPVE